MPKDAPLAIQVPAPDNDKPAWVKVGMIAAIGFVVGIAWPRVMGVRLGPSAPHEGAAAAAAAAAASASAHAGRAPEAPPASVTVKTPPAVSSVAAAPEPPAPPVAAGGGTPPTITLQKSNVLSCKTSDGETKKGKACGPVPGIDQLVNPRVKKIATCSGVEGQSGKLSLVVNADFGSGRFWFDVGKSSTVPNVDAVAACLKTAFHGTTATSTPHEHPRYTVAYTAMLAGGEDEGSSHKAKEAADDKSVEDKVEKKPEASAPGESAVGWEVALVRDTPKTGEIVGRLPRGTKVKVGTTKDGWYQVKFGDDFSKDGWVYRGAIGR